MNAYFENPFQLSKSNISQSTLIEIFDKYKGN